MPSKSKSPTLLDHVTSRPKAGSKLALPKSNNPAKVVEDEISRFQTTGERFQLDLVSGLDREEL
jgi:hypothetical protein